ncbi:hypothetical protein F4679DRAFT_564077 [Xylaria curta]|nr:hypothetical protein F4679DRAFT_564077 [Xylaria curta]
MHRQIHFLLCETSYYKSTDPRDKYFALHGLSPRSKRRLMYVDYTKSERAIFQHVTARCYNTSEHLGMTTTFKLLIESKPTGGDAPGPSWVHDFTYSDARYHESDRSGKVTFDGYLYTESNWQPEYDYQNAQKTMCFATPRSLFCSGLNIAIIRETGFVPQLQENEFSFERLYTFLKDVQVRQNWTKRQKLHDDGLDLYGNRISMIECLYADLYDAIVCHPERTNEFHAAWEESPRDESPLRLFYLVQGRNNINLFTLGGMSSLQTESATMKSVMQRRAAEVSGMQYFITDKGLVGIATAPVTEGDVLAVIHAAPAYFILREVKSSDGHSFVVQRHRMVARAVLSEKKDAMKKKMADLETRIFQIV